MENKKKMSTLLTGLLTILPIIIFVVILVWVFDLILGWVGRITSLFPQTMWDAMGLPEVVVNILGFLILCVLVWFIGFIMEQKRIGTKLKNWLRPVVSKVPLLSSLFKITNQVTSTLKDTNSFQKVVLVKFPSERTWSVGFITGENPETFSEVLEDKNLVSVFIPTTPNPTNGYLVLMNSKDLIETEVPVATAISFIISMGTAGATNEVLKKSYPSSE